MKNGKILGIAAVAGIGGIVALSAWQSYKDARNPSTYRQGDVIKIDEQTDGGPVTKYITIVTVNSDSTGVISFYCIDGWYVQGSPIDASLEMDIEVLRHYNPVRVARLGILVTVVG
jgi:hypothetical protein